MADLQRIEFEERGEQWFITEVYSDGSTRPGEPFPASGHENFPKLEQVQSRIKEKYPDCRPTYIPHNKGNGTWYVFSVVSSEAD